MRDSVADMTSIGKMTWLNVDCLTMTGKCCTHVLMTMGHTSVASFFAHSVPDAVTCDWEPLQVHLLQVSELAAHFAEPFNAREWGTLAGLWHDVGKYSQEFQNYLLTANGLDAHIEQKSKVDHATAGAQHAAGAIPVWGRLLAYIIAGHHAGLADARGGRSSLAERLVKQINDFSAAPSSVLDSDIRLTQPPLTFDQSDPNIAAFQLAFFTRMLFSCLVDADFLATEQFMSPDRARVRPSVETSFVEMQSALNERFQAFTENPSPSEVDRHRQDVLRACRERAKDSPGLFSLTVPTGGGKTLSSLAFAIDHAIEFDKTRIIYAIPFTSIIEQAVGVFRNVFEGLGEQVVLEHHSNLDPDDSNKESYQSRLAAENWDAPLVVTTNVQLFESLFAARTSRCRKLHNLVNSVIILDEAQTLPVDRLRPCIAVLEELVRNYGCTIVLCTATQPAIHRSDDFSIGLEHVREIIPHPRQLYQKMKRVSVRQLGRLTDGELVEQLAGHEQFLTIVNTRGHAASLYRDLVDRLGGTTGTYHLSTLMCGQHRADVIAEIRSRLDDQQACRVISTQLIEAGVDVDFPVVYRAMTGMDSIAQAAGRCNREGRRDSANVYVFDPTDVKLHGYLKSVAQTAREVAPGFDDLLDPAALEMYFRLHYWQQQGENHWDGKPETGVMSCFPFGNSGAEMPYDFRTADSRFQMIEENGRTVFVQYGDGEQRVVDLVQRLQAGFVDRRLLRRLQRCTVTLFDRLYVDLLREGDIEEFHEGQFAVLSNPSAYDDHLGVRIDRPGYIEPATLVR